VPQFEVSIVFVSCLVDQIRIVEDEPPATILRPETSQLTKERWFPVVTSWAVYDSDEDVLELFSSTSAETEKRLGNLEVECSAIHAAEQRLQSCAPRP
jgi:hypothetical protein